MLGEIERRRGVAGFRATFVLYCPHTRPPLACHSSSIPLTQQRISALLSAQRPAFLAFVRRRVRDEAAAEDLLQEAFLRGMKRADTLRDEAALVGWFYRILRNVVVDHYRGSQRQTRRFADLARDLEVLAEPEPEAAQACQCIKPLAQALKPEYAEALHRIDVEGVAVKDYASQIGISASNAGVRVHRARNALKSSVMKTCGACASAGCGQCTCAAPSGTNTESEV